MAEYGSSGIWKVSTGHGGVFRHGMVEHAVIGLSAELATRFVRWIELYEQHNLDGTLDTDAFNVEGLTLATALRAHIGHHAHIEYQGEADDGGLLAPVAIDGAPPM